MLGGRGPFGNFAPDSELNTWFRKQYFDRYNTWPTYPAYKAAQALLGMKTAYEKAAKGGNLPATDEVVAALENLVFEGPGGTVKMALANGHQAILDTAYGRYKYDKSTGQATTDRRDNVTKPNASTRLRASRALTGSTPVSRVPNVTNSAILRKRHQRCNKVLIGGSGKYAIGPPILSDLFMNSKCLDCNG